jgi:hypothetical protein
MYFLFFSNKVLYKFEQLSFTFMNVSKKDERKENRIIQKKF